MKISFEQFLLNKISSSKKPSSTSIVSFTNLSSHTFSPSQTSTLGLGLKFIPTPLDTTDAEFKQASTYYRNNVQVSFFFKNKQDRNFDPRLHRQREEPWLLESQDINRQLNQCTNMHTSYIDSFLSNIPVKNRLDSKTKRIRQDIKDLKAIENVVFCPADKGLGMTAIDLIDYHSLCMDHLNDQNTYLFSGSIEAFRDPNSTRLNPCLWDSINEDWLRTFADLLPLFRTFQEKIWMNYDHKSFKIPAFHILPKIHKDKISGRPIAGATNWWTTAASKYLNVILDDLLTSGNYPSILKDSTALCNFLEFDVKTVDPCCTMVSLDVISLYPSIDTADLLELLDSLNDKRIPILARFILENAYVEYAGNVWKQIRGLTMGTNCAVNLANFYLASRVDCFLSRLDGVEFYRRYVDDIVLFWYRPKEELEELMQFANTCAPGIRFTMIQHSFELVALDLTIIRDPLTHDLSFKTYTKPMSRHLYIPPSSCHEHHVFPGFIKGELLRFARTCSHSQDFTERKLLFFQHLLGRGYSRTWLSKIMSKTSWQDRIPRPRPSKQLKNFYKVRYSRRPVWKWIRKSLRGLQDSARFKNVALHPYQNETNALLVTTGNPSIQLQLCPSRISPSQITLLKDQLGDGLSIVL
jgi:hypothetical protein